MRILPNLFIFVIVCTLLSVSRVHSENLPFGKLPLGVTPTAYDLHLVVTPASDRFSGTVRISAVLDQDSHLIWLHGQGLDVEESYILDGDGTRVSATYNEVRNTGLVKFEAGELVKSGEIELIIKYSAAFNTSSEGLYKSVSGDQNYIYTDLQPLDARRFFPSFDEPRFKTPFTISVDIPTTDIAVSNTPIEKNTVLANNSQRIEFQQTKPLPTYLIALAVGDFDVVNWNPIPANDIRSAPIPLRGIAPKGEGEKFHYALKHTEAMIKILEEYFGIPYPYAKLDLVAPSVFLSGGMENAGAIFYRKEFILMDEKPSIYQLRTFASIHAHELAHSWFGNLVTPAWWDDIWLNESFASWMSAKVLNTWRSEEFNDRNTIRQGNRAKGGDQLISARQIRQPVKNNNDIVSAFDSITYSKGASVLSMIERYMGPEAFRAGIHNFLSQNAHGVSTADSFFTAITQAADNPNVLQAFRSFIEQPGTPHVSADWTCNSGDISVTLTQSRSLPLGTRGKFDKLWSIPMCLAYGSDKKRSSLCVLLTEEKQKIKLPTNSCPAWILPNADGAAYINFSLPSEGWRGVIENKHQLKPSETLSVISSMSAAYSAGTVSTSQLLDMAKTAAISPNWDVAKSPMQALRRIKLFVLPESEQSTAKAIMRKMYGPALAQFDISKAALAKDEVTSNQALLRGSLIRFMALDAEDPELTDRLSALGQAYVGHGTDNRLHKDVLHPNLVRNALTMATQDIGLPFVDILINHLKPDIDITFRQNIIAALGYQTNDALRERVWSLILDPSTRKSVASQLLRNQGRRVANRGPLFEWITENYDQLLTRIPRSHHAWLVWRASNFCDNSARDRIETFFSPKVKSLQGAPRALRNVLERIEICTAINKTQQRDAVRTINIIGNQ